MARARSRSIRAVHSFARFQNDANFCGVPGSPGNEHRRGEPLAKADGRSGFRHFLARRSSGCRSSQGGSARSDAENLQSGPASETLGKPDAAVGRTDAAVRPRTAASVSGIHSAGPISTTLFTRRYRNGQSLITSKIVHAAISQRAVLDHFEEQLIDRGVLHAHRDALLQRNARRLQCLVVDP